VARSSSSQAVLAFRSSVQRDADILPDLDVRDLQTADGYRSLLSKGTPILRLLPADEFVVHFPHDDKDPLGPASTVLLGDYKLIRVYETGQRRLFDVAKDPGERLDLAEAMPDKVKDLDARLTDYLQSVHAQIPTRNPNFDPSKAVEPTPLRKQKKDTKGDRGRKGRAT
jgi:hypothetical protein